jgi:ABC-type transport system involved in multi-copper enzyme maturation permease subunit
MLKGHFAAVLLIAIGTILLLDNLGLISFSFVEIVRIGWPVLLIGLGIALFFTPGDSKKSK